MVKDKAKCTFCAYIGPSIRGVVQNGTIYEGSPDEVKARLADAIEKFPRIAALIVKGDQLADARVKVRTKGNYLFEENRRFVAELKKGV